MEPKSDSFTITYKIFRVPAAAKGIPCKDHKPPSNLLFSHEKGEAAWPEWPFGGAVACTIKDKHSNAAFIGVSHCSMTDRFDVNKGKEIAMMRALAEAIKTAFKTVWNKTDVEVTPTEVSPPDIRLAKNTRAARV